mmetsp:Transcript_34711/g.79559  ORF Transcript_34711/g.79559 Transcript_34711/m.79559 type:complete len:400 (-) Transcript_34711:65-1264(-)
MSKGCGIHPILGTMTFGAEAQVKPEMVTVMLRTFCGAGCAKTKKGVHLDTARLYQIQAGDGDTESVLGACIEPFPSMQKQLCIATKASPQAAPHHSLSKESVLEQCETSLSKLGLESVPLFYLHSPDIHTSIDETLDAVAHLHCEGKIQEFGLSNYPAWMVVDIWHRCKAKGMVLPTVYQAMYNVVTRDIERELIPVARRFGLRLHVYNPLAGGILTGRYASVQDVQASAAGRFSSECSSAKLYTSRYSKQAVLEGADILRQACAPKTAQVEQPPAEVMIQESVVEGVRVKLEVTESVACAKESEVDMAGAALRWLIHHSQLQPDDGIILGVSKVDHLAANLGAWHLGPLPEPIAQACEEAWQIAKPACEAYFRGLGEEPGGTETFLKHVAGQAEKKAD